MEGTNDEALFDLLPTPGDDGTKDDRGGNVLDANKLLFCAGGG